ncbi:hypothetical protein TTHERM_00470940 (macronuclear) [Tetrahymena thermophila SB210]|uniref:Uncharacterized protein n=1 Tax=Tetrahymena thermophila (strain SB210) TaxID=312017 RepID=I7MGM1_TETTS|nr:hypothetical protein TTHERM_00470940 [Tetrahymena thermophila SB210]EAR85321.2 hypothetical protein TTHERM_00470940 [Tetrahymena thermophila SB210]|eukprot:XP_001032984.2 hypothetical protein TTHERM_00470940 [Tetrahymena thermophila SB210]
MQKSIQKINQVDLDTAKLQQASQELTFQKNFDVYDESLLQSIENIQKKYKSSQNLENLQKNEDFKSKDWSEQVQHILLTKLVPTYLSDVSQQIVYSFNNELELKTQFLQEQVSSHQLKLGEKQREIDRLSLDINFLSKKEQEREVLYEQKWNDILNQIIKREQEFSQICQEKTKYWIERINEITTLFLEVKNFVMAIKNYIPREVYMGELFRFKKLFSIEELMEKSIYSQNHQVIWELYHDLETQMRSFQTEKEILQLNLNQYKQQCELLEKKLQRQNMEILEYQQKILYLEEDNAFYIQEIEEVKRESEQVSQKIEKNCQEIIIKKNQQIEQFHQRYLSVISNIDQIITSQDQKVINLESFLANLNKEQIALKRENQELIKELQHTNEQKSRQAKIYEDSLEYMKQQKKNLIYQHENQIKSEKLAYEENIKAIKEQLNDKANKYQSLYSSLLSKIQQQEQAFTEKESYLSYQQIQETTSLDMLKQISSQEEKIEQLTEQNNFYKQENNLLKQKIENYDKEISQLEKNIYNSQQKYQKWFQENEENQIKIKGLTLKIEQQRKIIDEKESQISEFIDKQKKFDKEFFQQKMNFEFEAKSIKQQSQREVDKMRRELDDKLDQQIQKFKQEFQKQNLNELTAKNSREQIKNNNNKSNQSQTQFDYEQNYDVRLIVAKAVKQRESELYEEHHQNVAQLKQFYENSFKQLYEELDKQQKASEQQQKQHYENLLQDSKKHHSKLQESLISDNSNSYDIILKEELQKSSMLEGQCLLQKQLNLELTIDLKKQTFQVDQLSKKIKELEEESLKLKHQVEEQNLQGIKQKKTADQKLAEIDYLYKVEKEKYLSTLRREKDLSKQLQILQIEYQEQLNVQNNLQSSELKEIKQVIKNQYEDQLNKICIEQSVFVNKIQEEFSNFKDLSNKRYNTLKLKYEDLLLITQTQQYFPVKEPSQEKQLDGSPVFKTNKNTHDHNLFKNQAIYNGLKKKNITSRAYTSLSQKRDENVYKFQDFNKFSQSIDFNQSQYKDSKILNQTHSDLQSFNKSQANYFNQQPLQNDISRVKQTINDDNNFEGTFYLKKYPFTKVNSYLKNAATIDTKRDLNKTFSLLRTSESRISKERGQANKNYSFTPNKLNQSLDLDQLDDYQKKVDNNKKVYMNRKYNIFASDSKQIEQSDIMQPSLEIVSINLNQPQPCPNKTGYGQTFTEQINFKHNQLYSTLKHFKNNTVKIERQQIKLSNLPLGSNN